MPNPVERVLSMELPQIQGNAEYRNPLSLAAAKYDMDWKVAMSRSKNQRYYYNTRTGEKSWKIPKNMDPYVARQQPKRKKSRRARKRSRKKSSKHSFETAEAGGLDESDDEREIDQDTIRALKPPRNLRYMQLLLYFSSLLTIIFALITVAFAVWSLLDELSGPMGLLPSTLVLGVIGFALFILFTSLAGFCGTKLKKRRLVALFACCTFLTMACQAIVAVFLFIQYTQYGDAIAHQFYDLKKVPAYDSFTNNVLSSFAKAENNKWKRYQEDGKCCGYDVQSFLSGLAWESNMMNAVMCTKPFSSFDDIGAPISANDTDPNFGTKARSVLDMLEFTMAASASMKLGTNAQKQCIPGKQKDQTKSWYCPMNIAYNETYPDPSCSQRCISAIRALYKDDETVDGAFDETTERTLVAIEKELMCKDIIYATARSFTLAVSGVAFFLSCMQFAGLICAVRLALWYWDQSDIIIEDDDFEDSDDEEAVYANGANGQSYGIAKPPPGTPTYPPSPSTSSERVRSKMFKFASK